MLFVLTLFMPFLALGFLFWYVIFRVGCAVANLVRPFLPIGRQGGRSDRSSSESKEDKS